MKRDCVQRVTDSSRRVTGQGQGQGRGQATGDLVQATGHHPSRCLEAGTNVLDRSTRTGRKSTALMSGSATATATFDETPMEVSH